MMIPIVVPGAEKRNKSVTNEALDLVDKTLDELKVCCNKLTEIEEKYEREVAKNISLKGTLYVLYKRGVIVGTEARNIVKDELKEDWDQLERLYQKHK